MRRKRSFHSNIIPWQQLAFVLVLTFLLGTLAPLTSQAQDGLEIDRAVWRPAKSRLVVKGEGPARERLTLTNADSETVLGEVTIGNDGKWRWVDRSPLSVPCQVIASVAGQSDSKRVRNAPNNCVADPPPDSSDPPPDNTDPPPDNSGIPPDGGGAPATGSHAGRFSAYEGTQTCLACHETEALQIHGSVHYQWKGDASETLGLDDYTAGKLGGINDFCIYPDINWIGKLTNVNGELVDGGCAKCHVGFGGKPSPDATPQQLENIDCLVCHSSSYQRTVAEVDGAYRFVADTENMSVTLLQAATDLQLPDNDSCLNCHTKAGGGNNFKRGDIEEAHRDATADFDVHMASTAMGGAGLSCLDCHTSEDHKIAGRGTDLRPRENPAEVSCAKCHGDQPHDDDKIDKHTARVNCTVCHIPQFAKIAPTDMDRDWSQPGDLVAAKGLYEPHHAKGQNVTPEYRFFNGLSYFYQFGDPVTPGPDGRVVMSAPVGSINDEGAKIHAFKHHLATQPIDPVTQRLLPLKIGKFFESGEIEEAVTLGVQAVGWDDNGHEFVETERYMGLYHEVAAKEQALSCASCHDSGNRLDFAALGYTPKQHYNNRPLCASCHEDESDEWNSSELFSKLHEKHVKDKKLDCAACHTFSAAN